MAAAGGGRKFAAKIKLPELAPASRVNLDDHFHLKLEGGDETRQFTVFASDLERIRELGRGAYGTVDEMRHPPSNKIFAVKRISTSSNAESQKRMLVELDTCKKSGDCAQMVTFYGAMFREGDVWLCMEVMDLSLDQFCRRYKTSTAAAEAAAIPERFIARLALAIVDGLNFMKTQMSLIHRDVKPSNVLLNRQGEIKICDFGISGHLTNSVAKTIDAGCRPYMPPERIEGDAKDLYGVQADVWSLGITIIEVAMGAHPYARWKTPFEQLKQVVAEPPPTIDAAKGYTLALNDFVAKCLIKNYRERPKYDLLLQHEFLVNARADVSFDAGTFVTTVLNTSKAFDTGNRSVDDKNMGGIQT